MKLKWKFPHPVRFLFSGFIKLKGNISELGKGKLKEVFIRVGTRTIPCELEELGKKGSKAFNCFIRFGWGFKLCEVFIKFDDGTEQKVGQRLVLSIRLSWESLIPKFRPSFPKRRQPYENWLAVNKWSKARQDAYKEQAASLPTHPKISVIIPVFDPSPAFLEAAVESVLAQIYENWELCIADDGSSRADILSYLAKLEKRDSRIKVVYRPENGGIAVASNEAISHATGEFLAFLDHDDLLAPEALVEVAHYVVEHPETDFLYSDDDKIDGKGRRKSPQFKPDWSPELLLSHCYVCHLKVARKSLSQEMGHVREGFDGSQDYDYALRITERARHVGHIPKILYHWRVSPGSTAAGGDQKPRAFDAGLRAVQEACKRRRINADVIQPKWARQEKLGMFKMEFPDDGPSVAIIIPTHNNAEKLSRCLQSLKATTYGNYSVSIIDNENDHPEAVQLLQETSHSVIEVPHPDRSFNFSHLINRGVEMVDSEYVLLLNDDVEVLEPGWLSQMVGLLGIEGVGAVGAKLLFSNRKIQHAGVIHGMHEGLAGSAFRGIDADQPGYLSHLRVPRNYSAVTAACLLTKKELIMELGGLNENIFAVAYNDVDFCYRLMDAGHRCVYSPDAELIHHEGASRGFDDDPLEIRSFKDRYANRTDPYHNPNLSLKSALFEIQPNPTSPKPNKPISVLAVSHNLNLEGAPLIMFDMIVALYKKGAIQPEVVSMKDGPLRENYEAEGIPVRILRFHRTFVSLAEYSASLDDWMKHARLQDHQLVYANTIDAYFAIDAANVKGIPSIWNIYESLPPNRLLPNLLNSARKRAYECFQWPHRVIFGTDSTQNLYAPIESNNNFISIHNSLNPKRFPSLDKEDKTNAKKSISIDESDHVILCVGTLCERKGQMDLVKAFEELPEKTQKVTTLLLVGETVGKYGLAIKRKINSQSILKRKVRVIETKPNPWEYYRSADFYVCCSRSECYPMTILEAMHFSLPIVTTPTYGIRKQVRDSFNGWFYENGDVKSLSQHLERLIKNHKERKQMGENSLQLLHSLETFEEMLDRYKEIFRSANVR